MSATRWKVVVLTDPEGGTEPFHVSGEKGDDVIFNADGSVSIRRSWRSTGGGHRSIITYPAWRVTEVEEKTP